MTIVRPWDSGGLFLKAKLFINHALDDDRASEERMLWASLALELLAKAALSRVSPVLIATPSEEGNSLLVATGLIDGDVRFRSIQAKTLFTRCAKAFKPFNEGEALEIAQARNAYLHTATPTITKLPESNWWPRYWAQAHILITASNRELDEFVGSDRVDEVEKHLAQNQKNLEDQAAMLLQRAVQQYSRFKADEMHAKELHEWVNFRPALTYSDFIYHEPYPCIICEGMGELGGDEISEATPHHDEVPGHGWQSWVELTVYSDFFGCENCHLVLDRHELIQIAELPETFTAEGEIEDFAEPEYGND